MNILIKDFEDIKLMSGDKPKGKAKQKKATRPPVKTAELGARVKGVETRVGKLEKTLQEFIQGVQNDFGVLFNRMDKVDALGDRHSTQIRTFENFARTVKPTIDGLIKDTTELKTLLVPEEEAEEEEEPSEE